VGRALELMMSMRIRYLPVIDADGRVLGLINEVAIAHEYVRARGGGRCSRRCRVPR
jgi:CBS-domain-containing membrane protein